MADRPEFWPLALHGSGMPDWVVRELEVGRRVGDAEDAEACGMGPLLDAHFAEYMARCDEKETTDA